LADGGQDSVRDGSHAKASPKEKRRAGSWTPHLIWRRNAISASNVKFVGRRSDKTNHPLAVKRTFERDGSPKPRHQSPSESSPQNRGTSSARPRRSMPDPYHGATSSHRGVLPADCRSSQPACPG
jgi:hypothetical protein